ncbi:hypothetical protein PV334_33575 [Streptomyces sp. ME02-7008A-1]|uniref:hypothetical protein n=1 Tax=unclassified Streptomyces TaxID=2593676 RepID=UPI0029A8A5EB|nr:MULTISPECIES: hypothetical protein [unclassified Streptomyces]MDX3186172.1 hypothetical protein [Streptomyces sp. ME02-7008A-1]MDX3307089.1 hypothetical protein [Streptomyces sp. ME02-7008A]
MPDNNPCDQIKGYAREFCDRSLDDGTTAPDGKVIPPSGGVTDTAADLVKDLAKGLCDTVSELVAPKSLSAPVEPDDWSYAPFMWLGQHIAVAIFICVVVMCALTAWQGLPRLRQMGASTGWTLVAIAGMSAVPAAIMELNKAVSHAFTAAFNADEATLFGSIQSHLEEGGDAGNPLAQLLIISALVVLLAFAGLVFIARQLGTLAFVCAAPLVLASLARGGDTTAVRAWINRLLGLLFTPMVLLLVTPFIPLTKKSLVLDTVLLLAVCALMLRMIFHGVPYVGPRIAGAARSMVESRTTNPVARAIVRAGVPDVYEQENGPRGLRTVPTPARAVHQERGVLLAAYGVPHHTRPGRLTTASTIKQVNEGAERHARLTEARRQARVAMQPRTGAPQPRQGPPVSPAGTRPPAPAPVAPAPQPATMPTRPPNP